MVGALAEVALDQHAPLTPLRVHVSLEQWQAMRPSNKGCNYYYHSVGETPLRNLLKAPDRCAQLFGRERYSITDKHTEVLDCISCVA